MTVRPALFARRMPLVNRRQALCLPLTLLLPACDDTTRPPPAWPSSSPPSAPVPAAAPTAISLGTPLLTIEVPDPRAGELHTLYDLEDSPALFGPMPRDEVIEAYRARAAEKLKGSLLPRDLLERQRAVMAAIGTENGRDEARNATLLLEGKAGVIGPATCLEGLLFREQARRFPMIERPSEFAAFILRGKGRIRVYFSSMESVGGKIRGEVTERVRADIAAGFALFSHLHNHPFLFDRVPGDRMWTTPETVADVAGAVAPSINDVQWFRAMREEIGLPAAWVTNGLDTGRFTARDFDVLMAAAPR